MTTTPKTETAAKKDVTKLQRAIVDGLEDVKAQDIQVFNTEHLSPLFERVIVASGTSNRQTKALAASVRDAVKEAGFDKPRMEGEENGEWIIVDCGAAVAHIMQPAIRQYYRLEEIWGDKPVRLKLGAAKPAPSAANLLADKKAAQKAAKSDAKAAPKSKAKAADSAKPAAKKTAAKSAAKPAAAKKPAAKTVAKGLAAPAASAKTATKTAANAVAKEAAQTAAKSAAKAAAKPAAAKKPAVKKDAAKVQTVVIKASVPRTAKPAAPAAKRAPRKAS
ncbi:ribosome silencing factor [Acidovorax sp. CCYZU-2555]|uniref:ribosome silencing factor n=1 Tax=Acidovorax sp. CCYZU-2555 TaxID=2835042 RepID=UPI001BCC6884|nr:ribosome silencing factor [Acidovorax sp. CCYZU-2555]MBS7781299.1 ribosome silencing factor [Acidovorax sp. CCYZU-2555]